MLRRIDLTEQKFGRLTAISYIKPSYWLFRCDCGAEKVMFAPQVKRGGAQSCGCLARELLAQRNKDGGHGDSKHPLYARWAGMIQRCTNPKHVGWKNYGAKGIKVCESWMHFNNFLADMGEPPDLSHSIERKDSSKGYEPGNCIWATSKQQSRNTSRNVFVDVGGTSKTVRDWEIHNGVGRGTYQRRIDLGWSHVDAVTQPVQAGKALRNRK